MKRREVEGECQAAGGYDRERGEGLAEEERRRALESCRRAPDLRTTSTRLIRTLSSRPR